MKKTYNFSILFLFLTLNFACTPKNNYFDQPVLTINNQSLTLKEFSKELAYKLAKQDLLSAKNPSLLRVHEGQILSDFIIQTLVNEDLKNNQIIVSDDEVNTYLKDIQSQYASLLSFQEELQRNNLSLESYKAFLKKELLLKKFFSQLQLKITPPTEEEILEYYNRHKGEYLDPEQVLLRQIVVKEKHQIEEIQLELKKGKKTFSELAALYSIAPESSQGGLVGWVEEGRVDFFAPAFKLKVGAISSIIESPFGFHLLKVEQKQNKKQLSYNEVKQKIFNLLVEEQEEGLFLKWLNEKLRKSQIKKNSDLLKSLKIETKRDF